jgi:hypothetical protein
MKKLLTVLASGILFPGCQKNNNESFEDKLANQEKIIIPAEEVQLPVAQ